MRRPFALSIDPSCLLAGAGVWPHDHSTPERGPAFTCLSILIETTSPVVIKDSIAFRGWMLAGHALLVAWWRHETYDLAFDEAAEGGCSLVAPTGSNGLVADGQSRPRQACRSNRRRQINNAGIAGPEQLISCRHLLVVDEDLALPALPLLVVRPGGRCGSGTEQDIPIGEKSLNRRRSCMRSLFKPSHSRCESVQPFTICST